MSGIYGAFDPSYTGLGELLISPEMEAGMRHFAEKGWDGAKELSPIGPEGDPHRGEYEAGWGVETGIREEPSRRAFARVYNDVDYAASVEFGNSRGSDGQYVLTRAIDFMKET